MVNSIIILRISADIQPIPSIVGGLWRLAHDRLGFERRWPSSNAFAPVADTATIHTPTWYPDMGPVRLGGLRRRGRFHRSEGRYAPDGSENHGRPRLLLILSSPPIAVLGSHGRVELLGLAGRDAQRLPIVSGEMPGQLYDLTGVVDDMIQVTVDGLHR